MTEKLIEFTCPKCQKQLTWAPESATVYCKTCDRWINAKHLKQTNPAKIDPESNQMTLF